MFYYGMYRDNVMRPIKSEKEMSLVKYEEGAIKRGMEFIAYSTTTVSDLNGWRFLICGKELESLLVECGLFWNRTIGISPRGHWEIYRLDRQKFKVLVTKGRTLKESEGHQLSI